MHGIEFLQDLAAVMIVAGAVTVLCHLFKQPVVLGYIIAGVIIGPNTPPFPLIQDEETIKTLGELGVIFLMFSLGIEFSLRKLKAVGLTAFIAAFLEIVLMVWLGYEIGRVFGWSTMDSLFLGAILSISSTTIIVKALADLGKTKERFSQLILGILIVEDILAIVMIALLSGIATTGELRGREMALTTGKLVVFLVTLLVVGLLTVPRLLEYVGRFKSNEMLLVAVLGICFGVCLAAVALGYSVALGAFMIGAIMAEARIVSKIEHLLEPIRDMFSAVFFVTIGLLIDPKLLVKHLDVIAVVSVAVVVGKVLTCSFGTFVAGHDLRTSMRVGMGLAQIGEFSFIIASLGLTLGVTSQFLYPVAVTVSAITTFLTPYLIRSADPFVSWFDRVAPQTVIGYLDLYTNWIRKHGEQRKSSMARRLIRNWTWQMILNAALVVAVFIAAAFIAGRKPKWLPDLPGGENTTKAFLWLGAMLAALPLIIAIFRKLQALGMLISEITVSRAAAGEHTALIRTMLAQAIPFAGVIGLGLLILALSSTLLPPINQLIVLVLVIGLVTWMFWRSFVRLYSRAQFALRQVLSQTPDTRELDEPAKILPAVFKEAQLRSVTLPEDSVAARRFVGELQLRSRTGASIIAIERGGVTSVNPGPDDELLAGDKVLLLGNEAQLEQATQFLETRQGQ